MKIAVFISVFCTAALASPAAFAQDTPKTPPVTAPKPAATIDTEKVKDIKRLLEITGTAKLSAQMMEQMLGQMSQTHPEIPEEFWTKFRARMDANELIALIVPIYDKHYTREDIQGLITFYESPLGRKVIATTPLVTQESMAAGQTWGQRIGEKVAQEMQSAPAPKKP